MTLNIGNNFKLREDGEDLVIEHIPSGGTLEYDDSENAWVPTDPIGTSGRRAANIATQTMDAQRGVVSQLDNDGQSVTLDDSVDAASNDVTNVGALSADSATVTNQISSGTVNTEEIVNIADHIVNSTLDGQSLQDFFDNDVSGGDTILFGPGTRTLRSEQSGAITLSNNNLTLRGYGPELTVFESPDTSTSGININGQSNITIRDLSIVEPNASNDFQTPRHGIATDIASDGTPTSTTTDKLFLQNVTVDGFRIGMGVRNIQERALLQNCKTINYELNAVSVSGYNAECHNALLVGHYSNSAGTSAEAAIEFDGVANASNHGNYDCAAIGCTTENANGKSFEIDDESRRTKLLGCTSVAAGRDAFRSGTDAIGPVEIIGCISYSSGGDGLNTATENTVVTGYISIDDNGNGVRVNGGAINSEINATVINSGSDGYRIDGRAHLQNCVTENAAGEGIQITSGADETTANGVVERGSGGLGLLVESNDCTIYGEFNKFPSDDGDRNIINGKSENAGDPSSGSGVWAGNYARARNTNAVIYDTNNEGTIYRALPASTTNDWLSFNGTVL